jgi:hypothetical protein
LHCGVLPVPFPCSGVGGSSQTWKGQGNS